MAAAKTIYYTDILSSWCSFAEEPLAKVRARGADLDYEWRISFAPMARRSDTIGKCSWYYGRSNSMSGVMLNVTWLEGKSDATRWPNVAPRRSALARQDR